VVLPAWWHNGFYAAFSLATGDVALVLLRATLLVTPVHRLRKHRRLSFAHAIGYETIRASGWDSPSR
jgi:hypothetical protein